MSPTGYTAELCEHDISFERFVWTCARAFGALITMRDDPLDAPIPDRLEPSGYHAKAMLDAQATIDRVTAMTDAECDEQAQADYQAAATKHLEYNMKIEAISGRLREMRAKVRVWQPPTQDHVGLKELMIEQLDNTIRYDGTPGTYYGDQVVLRTGKEWREAQIKEATKSLVYNGRENQAELERTRERNQWIADLRSSLQAETDAGRGT